MKRINPDTKKVFKQGDKRPSTDKQDGKIFYGYDSRKERMKNGFFAESWRTQEAYDKKKAQSRDNKSRIREEYRKNPLPKRLNKKTNTTYKTGDYENGKWFVSYLMEGKGKYQREHWTSDYKVLEAYCVRSRVRRCRRTAKDEGLPFDLTSDYLKEILPNPLVCPVFNTKMSWGESTGRDNTPSVDKIIIKKGYVKGNVVWISGRANRFKNNASFDEIEKLYKFMKKGTSV